jgi:hypothetical protein
VRGIKNFCSTYPIRYSEDKDSPATFFLEIEVEEGSPVILRNLLPVRAAGVDCEYQFRMSLYIEVSSNVNLYPYSVPECGMYRCGTYPSKSTLGNTQDMSIAVSGTTEVIPYEPVFTGTLPDTATNGYTGITIAEASTATNAIVYTSGFSANDTCGTSPTIATEGYMSDAGIEAGSISDTYTYESEYCGENPAPATTGYTYTSDIDTGGYGQAYRYDSEPCGSKQCGE